MNRLKILVPTFTFILLCACSGSAEPALIEPEQTQLVAEDLPATETLVSAPTIPVIIEEEPTSTAKPSPTAVPSDTPEPEATATAEPTAEPEVVSATDFDAIGQTGRPQLLNSYTTW